MSLRVTNDWHIGAERSAGTTVESRWQLRQSLIEAFRASLPDTDLMVLGDLFDSYNVSAYDVLKVFKVLKQWLQKGYKLFLVAGNHDLSKTSNVLSSFGLLSGLLESVASAQLVVITQPTMTEYGYVIPHLANQVLFNEALLAVPACDTLYLHCNYNNFFATESDQSLNLSKEQADAAPVNQIIIAHEHSMKLAGKILIPGNQVASSVSDWLAADTKYWVDDGALTPCNTRQTSYIELDWRALVETSQKFVRVVGTATAAEATQVVGAIAKFRAASAAFVITNAAQIETNEGLGDFSATLESVQGFDVWRALRQIMPNDDMITIESLT